MKRDHLKLYHRPDCPFCWKVRIFLAEIGLQVTEVMVKLGEKHPDVVALNPNVTVPVLVDGDLVLGDSAVIIEYLADRFPEYGLLSGTAIEKAKIRQLQNYSDTTIGQVLFPHIKRVRDNIKNVSEISPDQELRGAWKDIQYRLSQALEQGRFLRKNFSVADCALLPRIALAHVYGLPLGDEFHSLKSWFRNGVNRPSFMATLPPVFSGIDEMIKPEKFLI